LNVCAQQANRRRVNKSAANHAVFFITFIIVLRLECTPKESVTPAINPEVYRTNSFVSPFANTDGLYDILHHMRLRRPRCKRTDARTIFSEFGDAEVAD
jgi:hypothetical protein